MERSISKHNKNSRLTLLYFGMAVVSGCFSLGGIAKIASCNNDYYESSDYQKSLRIKGLEDNLLEAQRNLIYQPPGQTDKRGYPIPSNQSGSIDFPPYPPLEVERRSRITPVNYLPEINPNPGISKEKISKTLTSLQELGVEDKYINTSLRNLYISLPDGTNITSLPNHRPVTNFTFTRERRILSEDRNMLAEYEKMYLEQAQTDYNWNLSKNFGGFILSVFTLVVSYKKALVFKNLWKNS